MDIGFAFLSGLCLGFMIAFGLCANLSVNALKKSIANGMIEVGGVIYRIKRVDP